MRGAKEFAELFATGQYGRLYITSGSHARGKTFHIQILQKDEIALPNGDNNSCLNPNAVEVYGIVNGQPGWTESYGWLHKGKWVDDFNELIKEKRKQKSALNLKQKSTTEKRLLNEKKSVTKLLSQY